MFLGNGFFMLGALTLILQLRILPLFYWFLFDLFRSNSCLRLYFILPLYLFYIQSVISLFIQPEFSIFILISLWRKYVVKAWSQISWLIPQEKFKFIMKPGIYISGMSPEGVTNACLPLMTCGTQYVRLAEFSHPPVMDSHYGAGLIFQVSMMI